MCACTCMYICEHVNVCDAICVCLSVQVCAHVWNTEVDFRYLPPFFSTLLIEMGTLNEFGGQQLPLCWSVSSRGLISMPLPLQCYRWQDHTIYFYMGVKYQNEVFKLCCKHFADWSISVAYEININKWPENASAWGRFSIIYSVRNKA